MVYLKLGTVVSVQLGPFLDRTDGVSEETGLTPAVEVSKAGGAFAARNSATAVAHDSEGWYIVELDATDTGTLGRLIVRAQDNANHVPVWHEFEVVSGVAYNRLIGADTTFTYTLTDSDTLDPIPDAYVAVFSDSAMTMLVSDGYTDENGVIIFYLDPGTYYFFRRKTGYSFDNPDTEVVG